jgi:spermidine/putrescine-binding protein
MSDWTLQELLRERWDRPVNRREFMRVVGGGLLVSAAAPLIAACGASTSPGLTPTPAARSVGSSGSPASATAAGAASPTPKPLAGTLNWIGFDGEDGGDLGKAWSKQTGVTLNSTYISSQDDIINKLEIGGGLDVVTPNNGYISVLDAAGFLATIDESRVPNASSLFPVLRDATWRRNASGAVLAVPTLWGDGPFIYNPKTVPAVPKSALELTKPLWKGQLVWMDDTFDTIYGFARALGYHPANLLTPAALSHVVETMRPAIKNGVAIASSYGDATDQLVRGEASLVPIAWEAMIGMAAPKGVTLAKGFFVDMGAGWCDSYSIPKTASNVDAAYAFIDYLLSPTINSKMASATQSGATTTAAYALLSPADQTFYDYGLVKDPNFIVKIDNVFPPAAKGQYTTISDWNNAWAELKA